MALTELQQVHELVRKSRHTLIIYKKDWTGDAVSGSLALYEFLIKLGKKADIVCQDFKPSANLSYLPVAAIKTALSQMQKFVVSVDLSRTGLAQFESENNDDRLELSITPESGRLTEKDIVYSASGYKYDLILLVNTPDLASLGEAYCDNSDFFHATAKINFDHSAQNEHYGDINLVNIAYSSASEIVYEFIREYDESLIDHNIATYALSGMISATKNFKTARVTPRTLNLAGSLISYGARRDQIIQNLYQSRFLMTLKLWGRVLSRLKNDLNDKIIWSALSASDFIETSTDSDELPEVVEELISSMPKTEIVVLFYEEFRAGLTDIKVMVYAIKNRDAMDMARKFNPAGSHELAKFTLPECNLIDSEKIVIEEIKNRLK